MLKGIGDTYIYIIDKIIKFLYCNDNASTKNSHVLKLVNYAIMQLETKKSLVMIVHYS